MINTPYVRINSPLVLRRDILKNALDTTRLVKYYEMYSELRKEKVKKFKELKGLMLEVDGEMNVLREILPHVKGRHENKKIVRTKSSKIQHKAKSKIDKINLELKEIERKLESI